MTLTRRDDQPLGCHPLPQLDKDPNQAPQGPSQVGCFCLNVHRGGGLGGRAHVALHLLR